MRRQLPSIMTLFASMHGVPMGLRRRLLALGGIAVGTRTTVRSGCTFAGPAAVSIGQDCYISYQCVFDTSAPITIDDGVYIAHRVNIVTSTHAIGSNRSRRASSPQLRKPVTIGRGSWLGAGSMVLPGVSVGDGCVIAAGAVVTVDCAPDGLFAGVPARRVRDLPSD